MDTEQFLHELNLPANADIGEVENTFTAIIKERIQNAAQAFDEVEFASEEEWLREAHACYFQYCRSWIEQKLGGKKQNEKFESAKKLKKEAVEIAGDLEKNIIDFAVCYMHINRYYTLLRQEFKTEEIKISGTAIKPGKWTSDIGEFIERNKNDQRKIVSNLKKIRDAQDVIQEIEKNINDMRKAVLTLTDKDSAEAYLRRFNAAMRTAEFEKAGRALAQSKNIKKKFTVDQKKAAALRKEIENCGQHIVTLARENQKVLTGLDDRLLMRQLEADHSYNSQIRELKKIRAFLGKYHLPYMQHKIDTLSYLKDKLMIAGTPESLAILYKRLVAGIAVPFKDINILRTYEGEVLGLAKHLLSSQFVEISTIMVRADEAVREFREDRRAFDELNNMKLKEKEIKGRSAAQASG